MRVVAKIGTSSLTDDQGVIDVGAIAKLCDEVAALRGDGHEVVVVSSGAVSAGVAALGLAPARPTCRTLQALSAAGQSRLMEVYNRELARHGLVAAQVLLAPHDFVERRQYLHARRRWCGCSSWAACPIVNENDAIANDEIRYGDNDRIAALVAHNVAADLLVLLTDTPGAVHRRPATDPSATLIALVEADDPLLAVRRQASGQRTGGAAAWPRSWPRPGWRRGPGCAA